MSSRGNSSIESAFKRIKLKEEYLELFLPEIIFLNFLQNFENFEGLLEGISGKELLTEKVDLKTIRDNLEELKINHRKIISQLKALCKYIERINDNNLVIRYHANLEDCKKYLGETLTSFLEEIELHKQIVYNIKILLQINDSLEIIKSRIKVLVTNLDNLKKSTIKSDLRKVLTKTYTTAISSLNTKFTQIKGLFPETKKSLKMALKEESTSTENLPDCEAYLRHEKQFDYLDCMEKDICPCDAPPIPDVFKVEKVCEISSSSSSQKGDIDEATIIQEYQNEVDKRKDNLYKILSELLMQSRDISRIDNEIFTKKSENEVQTDCIFNKKDEVNNDPSLNESAKIEQIKAIDCVIAELNARLVDDVLKLENQKSDIRKDARCKLKELKRILKIFNKEHTRIMDQLERLKLKVFCREKIEVKLDILQHNFEKEMNNIEEYREKICNVFDGEESVSSFSTSSESVTSSTITKSSLSREAELLKVKGNELYLKKTEFIGIYVNISIIIMKIPDLKFCFSLFLNCYYRIKDKLLYREVGT